MMRKYFKEALELMRLAWYVVWLLPALPELFQQAEYEQKVQTGEIS